MWQLAQLMIYFKQSISIIAGSSDSTYCCCSVAQFYLTILRPHGLQPIKLLCLQGFPGKNTGVGCHFLLQGIFPTQMPPLHWQVDSLPLTHQEAQPYLLMQQIFSLGMICKILVTFSIRSLQNTRVRHIISTQ